MISKQIQAKKMVQPQQVADQARQIWLAGLGAVSIAQKQGKKLYGNLVAEGKTLQTETLKIASRVADDVNQKVTAIAHPLQQRVDQTVAKVEGLVEERVARVLSRLGVPTKADIDELVTRVAELSKQLKSARK